jgi:hypothetical protein
MEAIDLHKEVLRVRPFLQPALDLGNNTHDYVHIVNGILNGTLQLWPTENSALVTEFHNYPNKKYLHIFIAGGDLDEIRGVHPDLVSFAKATKCDGLTLNGRPGWIKALADLGFASDGLRYVTQEFNNE